MLCLHFDLETVFFLCQDQQNKVYMKGAGSWQGDPAAVKSIISKCTK